MCQNAHSLVSEGGGAQAPPSAGLQPGAEQRRTMRRSQRGLVGRGGRAEPGAGGTRRAARAARLAGIAAPAPAAGERCRGIRSPFAPRLPPPSERCPGRAGSEAAAAEGRPERERRGHGGKRSVPPFQLSPLPLPRPAEQRPFSLALHARAAATGGAALRSRLAAPALPGLAAALGPPGGPALCPPRARL